MAFLCVDSLSPALWLKLGILATSIRFSDLPAGCRIFKIIVFFGESMESYWKT